MAASEVQLHEQCCECREHLVSAPPETMTLEQLAIAEGELDIQGDQRRRPLCCAVGVSPLDQPNRSNSEPCGLLQGPQYLEVLTGGSTGKFLDGVDRMVVGNEANLVSRDALGEVD